MREQTQKKFVPRAEATTLDSNQGFRRFTPRARNAVVGAEPAGAAVPASTQQPAGPTNPAGPTGAGPEPADPADPTGAQQPAT